MSNRARETCLRIVRSNRLTASLFSLFRLFRKDSYLQQVGWFRSSRARSSVDGDGCPIPWFAYGAIHFLERRIHREMSVFEFGSGNSTLWWAERVSKLVSCEHDEPWYREMRQRMPANVEYLHFDLEVGGSYSRAILNYGKEFDIIVVDGRDRVNCARNALGSMKPGGVIVWDNTERERYREGYDHLSREGFKRIDFEGLAPIVGEPRNTSVFYRPDNCLGL